MSTHDPIDLTMGIAGQQANVTLAARMLALRFGVLKHGAMRLGTFEPVEIIGGGMQSGILLIADHAMRLLPPEYGRLGLDEAQFERHIAYDIGVEGLTRSLAARLGCPAVMARFSRLLIDPNRGEDDPTLIRQLYDGAVIPGNYPLSEAERANRTRNYYQPFRQGVRRMAAEMLESAGAPPIVISAHSFTPSMGGRARPWHVGMLWDKDSRAAAPLIEMLRAEPGMVVGDNEPYDGALHGDTLHEICTRQGIAHALIEVRQDLIASEKGIEEWAARLAPMLAKLNALAGMHEIQQFGSRAKA
jgi:predicted N-formylglutamate amidohydrolase